MIMKSRRILAVLAACTAVTFTGCGVVTVVPNPFFQNYVEIYKRKIDWFLI